MAHLLEYSNFMLTPDADTSKDQMATLHVTSKNQRSLILTSDRVGSLHIMRNDYFIGNISDDITAELWTIPCISLFMESERLKHVKTPISREMLSYIYIK